MWFTKVDRILYRWGFATPLLRCISLQEAQYVLAEMHKRVCENHSGSKALARKVIRVGHYWPNALGDVKEFIKKYVTC